MPRYALLVPILAGFSWGSVSVSHGADDELPRAATRLLVERCGQCHGRDKQEGGLRFDRLAVGAVDRLDAGDSGAPAIVPGDSTQGELARRVSLPADDAERMPPADAGEPLSAAERESLLKWIAAGAKPPAPSAEAPSVASHWAFQPLDPTKLGPLSIDERVAAKLAEQGLTRNPPADRRTLVRRLYLDVLGLPPPSEDVEAFVANDDPYAYARLVDQVLASPRYGERWARHWLDVVRFAESNGFEMNQERKNAWPYRDWVVDSLNADKPYDAFVREQIAGDSLGADVGTGFLVGGPWDQVKSPDPVLTAQQRADELHDMIATTGSAFLGLTIGCARCHSHKFDPIRQTDYYAWKAVFEGVQHGERALPGKVGEDVERRRAALAEESRRVASKLDESEPLASPDRNAKATRSPATFARNVDRFEPTDAKFVRFRVTATTGAEPCVDELEAFSTDEPPRNVALASAGAKATASSVLPGFDIHKLEHVNDGRYGNSRSWISAEPGAGTVTIEFAETARIDRVVWSRDRTEPPRYRDRVAVGYEIALSLDGQSWRVVAGGWDRAVNGEAGVASAEGPRAELLARRLKIEQELATLSDRPMGYVGAFTQPGPTTRLHRGDVTQPREAIEPASLSEFGRGWKLPADSPEAKRRLALAEWIASPENPLTARVIANRVWQHHFGRGLVDTPSDFGAGGAKPANAELLDALAVRLIESGWSLKTLHREILLTDTYGQSSNARADAMAVDADARYLWRFPPRRLEAEAIRDAALAAAGSLDLRMGGPGFNLFEPNANYVRVYTPKREFEPETFRRMVYQNKPRMQLDDVFGAFDCPDAGQIAPRRHSSVTPLQALSLLNSPWALDVARRMAERIERERPDDHAKQVEQAFAVTLQRSPTPEESQDAVALVAEHGLEALARALLNANEFLSIE